MKQILSNVEKIIFEHKEQEQVQQELSKQENKKENRERKENSDNKESKEKYDGEDVEVKTEVKMSRESGGYGDVVDCVNMTVINLLKIDVILTYFVEYNWHFEEKMNDLCSRVCRMTVQGTDKKSIEDILQCLTIVKHCQKQLNELNNKNNKKSKYVLPMVNQIVFK